MSRVIMPKAHDLYALVEGYLEAGPLLIATDRQLMKAWPNRVRPEGIETVLIIGEDDAFDLEDFKK